MADIQSDTVQMEFVFHVCYVQYLSGKLIGLRMMTSLTDSDINKLRY